MAATRAPWCVCVAANFSEQRAPVTGTLRLGAGLLQRANAVHGGKSFGALWSHRRARSARGSARRSRRVRGHNVQRERPATTAAVDVHHQPAAPQAVAGCCAGATARQPRWARSACCCVTQARCRTWCKSRCARRVRARRTLSAASRQRGFESRSARAFTSIDTARSAGTAPPRSCPRTRRLRFVTVRVRGWRGLPVRAPHALRGRHTRLSRRHIEPRVAQLCDCHSAAGP